jgi:ATP-dependent helicase/nuclease subunit A
MSSLPVDQAERRAALDPGRSFIVQAPAGSGKTGLLTQRFLRLLATVAAPEEVLAITFTRKAAGEMRERILHALDAAAETEPPADPFARETWTLARAARARDLALGWDLTRHPARLRVLTVDAFNAALTRQTPWLAGLGAATAVTDRAGELYQLAARRTLETLSSGAEWSGAVASLLLHLGNQVEQAESLLAGMLARREQWLPRLLGPRGRNRAALESALATEVGTRLARLPALIPAAHQASLLQLLRFAADRLAEAGPDLVLDEWTVREQLPGGDPAELPAWRGIAFLLLTKDNEWRRKVDRRQGFPPDHKAEKRLMTGLLEALAGHEHLRVALAETRKLPDPRYPEAQWAILDALRTVLPVLAGQLQLVFAGQGLVDHTEIALRALQALGEEENPTDLALALDYRISHVLVDEFQDTSTLQFRLLESLTRGWSAGDGRSLFLVGDPMQSIYRFREAEVGLFLRARHEGLGQVPLQFLRLRQNFRSRRPLVDWVNGGFPGLLAQREDAAAGAVPFEPAVPVDADGDGGVGVHVMVGEAPDEHAEAAAVAALVRARLAEAPDESIAILLRTRRQAAGLLPALRSAGLSWQAVDIEALAQRPVVQDLLALTRALLREHDRIAWLAVLRAPWCGLTLHELHALCLGEPDAPLPLLLADPGRRALLPEQPRARLERAWSVLAGALERRARGSLRRRVEATWFALGGPAAAGSIAALDDAQAFLSLVDEQEVAGDLPAMDNFEQALATLYARPDPAGDPRVQVLTIHKAKGLEFHTVILPGLHAGTGSQDQPLLLWTERPRLHGPPDLLLAPLKPAAEAEADPIYAFVSSLIGEQLDHELGRVLYVAVTRAIRRLELFAWSGPNGPRSGSLLERLWPVLRAYFDDPVPKPEAGVEGEPAARQPACLRRLPADWQAPRLPSAVSWTPAGLPLSGQDEVPVQFRWAGEAARLAGLVTHRLLQQVAEEGLDRWDAQRVAAAGDAMLAMARTQGAPAALAGEAAERAGLALTRTLADPVARWILGPHQEAAAELRLASAGPGGIVTRVIDRTFVDGDGTRWVIDYKTGWREGGDIDGFIEQEVARYRGQLAGYAALLRAMDDRPLRLGLYFPLLARFCEVAGEGQSDPASMNG